MQCTQLQRLPQLHSCPARGRCVVVRCIGYQQMSRRSLLAGTTGGLLLGFLQQQQQSASAEPSAGVGPSDIVITPAGKGFKSYMDDRDEAMRNKCPGGMFDCEGDRREFAKQQYKDFLAAGGKGERLRKGGKGPRSR